MNSSATKGKHLSCQPRDELPLSDGFRPCGMSQWEQAPARSSEYRMGQGEGVCRSWVILNCLFNAGKPGSNTHIYWHSPPLKRIGSWLAATEPSAHFPGHRGYVPAGKLQLYHPIIPSEKGLRGQTGMHEDYWLPTPEPTQPSVPTVPTMSQVSLEEG